MASSSARRVLGIERLVHEAEVGHFGDLDRFDRLAIDDGDVAAEVTREFFTSGEQFDERIMSRVKAEALAGDGDVEAGAGVVLAVAGREDAVHPDANCDRDLRNAALGEAEHGSY